MGKFRLAGLDTMVLSATVYIYSYDVRTEKRWPLYICPRKEGGHVSYLLCLQLYSGRVIVGSLTHSLTHPFTQLRKCICCTWICFVLPQGGDISRGSCRGNSSPEKWTEFHNISSIY